MMLEACSGSHHDVLERMILEGHDVNQFWPGHLTLLHVAASRSDVRSLEILINAGADVDALTARGECALHLACQHGYRLIVKALHQAKADIDIGNNKGETPLHVCVANSQYDCAKQLLWYGAQADARNIHGLRADDMMPTMSQPQDLTELFRATRLRQKKIG